MPPVTEKNNPHGRGLFFFYRAPDDHGEEGVPPLAPTGAGLLKPVAQRKTRLLAGFLPFGERGVQGCGGGMGGYHRGRPSVFWDQLFDQNANLIEVLYNIIAMPCGNNYLHLIRQRK